MLRRLLTSRRLIAALLVVVSFRYSVGVFEPLWATYLDDLGAGTMVVTISLTVFALPMLVIARWAGRLSDTLRAAAHVGAVGCGDGAADGVLRVRRRCCRS